MDLQGLLIYILAQCGHDLVGVHWALLLLDAWVSLIVTYSGDSESAESEVLLQLLLVATVGALDGDTFGFDLGLAYGGDDSGDDHESVN